MYYGMMAVKIEKVEGKKRSVDSEIDKVFDSWETEIKCLVLDVLNMKGPFTIAVKQIILKFKGHEKDFLLCIDFVGGH